MSVGSFSVRDGHDRRFAPPPKTPPNKRPAFCPIAFLSTLVRNFLHTATAIAAILVSCAAGANQNVSVAEVAPDIIKVKVEERDDIRFRRISLSQGLSQTRVSQIVQDDDGYLWFGTQHGVNRYDGQRFQVFKHELGNPESLSGIFIYSLFKDRNGTIWVGSDQFLDAFDKKTGTFRHYSLDPANPTVIHISEDSEGNLWLSTSLGLFRLDPATGKSVRFGHDAKDAASLSSDDIKSTGTDSRGVFWVASNAGLEAFDRASGKVSVRIPLREEVREFKFHEDAHGTFWIIYGSGNGLGIYDRKTNKLVRYSFEGVADNSLTGVYDLLEASNGDIWLATMGAGLLRFDREKFRFIRYTNDPNDVQSLAENRVIALYEDAEGNIWTGLHASPPNVFPKKAPPFQKLWPYPRHPDKLGESLVNAIFEDRYGAIWIGAGGALNRIDTVARTMEPFAPAGPGTSIEVLSITEDPSGTLWIGTLGGGLYAFDQKTKAFSSYRHDAENPQSISSDVVTRVLADTSGELWITTWNGIDRFSPGTGKFTTFKRNPAAHAETYFSVIKDERGMLWLGTTAGLVQFDPSEATFEVYKHDPDNPASLSNNTVNTIHTGGKGVLWVGTQNGLNRFDVAHGTFDHYFSKDGLAGDVVSCLLEDDDGYLWMSTNKGVSRMDVPSLHIQNYTTADGLPGNDLTGWNACSTGQHDRFYFGGFAGAVAGKSAVADHDTAYVPPVVLTGLKLSDLEGNTQSVDAAAALPNAVTLPYNRNQLAVSFAALSYKSPDTMKFRYMLSGLDGQWHRAGDNERTISYAALPSGTFTLMIQASTGMGEWVAPGTELHIVVLPPWWSTWWFRLAALIAVCATLAALYRYRLAKVSAQYRIRLEERINERNRLARELHDTLLQTFQGLIFRTQAARHMLPGRPGEAGRMLDLVLDKSDEAIIEGRNAVQALRDPTQGDDVIGSVKRLGEELAKAASGTTDFSVKIFGRPMNFDPSIRHEIVRIVCEALRNAFKHSGASTIECVFAFSEADLRVLVRDDGVGLGDKNGVAPGAKKCWGIRGMRERAEKIGADLVIKSSAGFGTTVELSVGSQTGPSRTWSGEPKQ